MTDFCTTFKDAYVPMSEYTTLKKKFDNYKIDVSTNYLKNDPDTLKQAGYIDASTCRPTTSDAQIMSRLGACTAASPGTASGTPSPASGTPSPASGTPAWKIGRINTSTINPKDNSRGFCYLLNRQGATTCHQYYWAKPNGKEFPCKYKSDTQECLPDKSV